MLTPRENFLETIRGGKPDRFVKQFEFFPMPYSDPWNATNPFPWEPGAPDCVDFWGVTWTWPKGTPGAFPRHGDGFTVLEDVEEWKGRVKCPPLEYSDELWEAAKKNFEKEAFFIETMESVLSEFLGEEVPEIKESQQGEGILYILSNRKREYGARAVLRTEELQRLADEQKSSFYLLPSSIHEWILCKDDGETDVHMMKEIVREINGDSHIINPEECLSDSIYYYDREQNEVRIVV